MRKMKRIGAFFLAFMLVFASAMTSGKVYANPEPGGGSGGSFGNIEFMGLSSTDGTIATVMDGEQKAGTVQCNLGAISSLNGDRYEYQNQAVGTVFTITLTPEVTYPTQLNYGGTSYNIGSSNCVPSGGSYTFTFTLQQDVLTAGNGVVQLDGFFGIGGQSGGESGDGEPGGEQTGDGDSSSTGVTVELRGLASTNGTIATAERDGLTAGTVACSLGDITELVNGDGFEYSGLAIGREFTLTLTPESGYAPQINYNQTSYGTDASNCVMNGSSYVYSFTVENNDNFMQMIVGFNPTGGGESGGGEVPGPEPAQEPLQLWIGDSLVIDETQDPVQVAQENSSYKIIHNTNPQPGQEAYEIMIKSASIPGIRAEGNGGVTLMAAADVTIDSYTASMDPWNAYSIYAPGVGFTMNSDEENPATIHCAGGIAANIWNRSAKLEIGNTVSPADMGIVGSDGSCTFDSDVTIHATGAVIDGMHQVIVANEAAFIGTSTQTAINNLSNIIVKTGGSVELSGTALGTIDRIAAGYYCEIGEIATFTEGFDGDGTKEVNCENGNHEDEPGRYTMDKTSSQLSLVSTAKQVNSLMFQNVNASESDTYIANGILKIEAGTGQKRLSQFDETYDFLFEEGTVVTVTLVPNYGYQYKTSTLKFNGQGVETGYVQATSTPGVYTFIMPNSPVHVSCTFEAAENAIGVDSKVVSDAQIQIPDGLINGTANFQVKDTTLTEVQQNNFAEAADGKLLGTPLELTMEEVIDKIDGTGSWSTSIKNLSQSMNVTLKLDASMQDGTDYEVIREHEGQYTVLDADFNSSDGTVTFATNQYSTYMIVYKNKTDESKENTITSTDGKTAIQDTTGVIPAGATITSEIIISGTEYENAKETLKDIIDDHKFVIAEINLSASDGSAIHNLDGTVTVVMDVPFAVEEGHTITVYRVDGTEYVKCEAIVKNGKLFFTTNHFSTYVFVDTVIKSDITNESSNIDDTMTNTNSPQTGDESPIVLLWVLIMVSGFGLCGFVYVGKRRKQEMR